MKKLFLSLLLFTFSFLLFSSTVFAQWWVKGGNLIWPYGNVTISKGNLTISNGELFIDKITTDNDSLLISNGASQKILLSSNSAIGLRINADPIVINGGTRRVEVSPSLFTTSLSVDDGINIYGSSTFNDGLTSEDGLTVNGSEGIFNNGVYIEGGLTVETGPAIFNGGISGNLTADADVLVDSTLTAHNVIETSSLEFVISVQIDEPFTAYTGTVHLNETGSAVDTVIYDNSTSKLVICFKPNANLDITDYDVSCLPVPVTFDDDTTAINLGYLTAFTTEFYAPTSLNSITGTLYNGAFTGLVTDFASGFFYLDLRLIPQTDTHATGYQTLAAPCPLR